MVCNCIIDWRQLIEISRYSVSALDAVPELVSILPDVKATNDIIKKPVALDDFIMAVKTVLVP